jgi:hypothetical protein
MANDYVSTTPWNDVNNPYPFYSQVALSAADIPLVTLTLNIINPNASSGSAVVQYTASGKPALTFNMLNYGLQEWVVWSNAAYVSGLYYQILMPRAVPSKQPYGTEGWSADAGANVNSLYINPITTSITPWEQRRRRLLEIV